MSTSVLYMSMSLDGYIAGPNDEVGNPGGDGFMRLHSWFATSDGEFFRPSGPDGELIDEINATGAVLIGRRLAEQIYRWVQRYAPELEKRFRSHVKVTTDSWRVDETYIKVKK